MSYNLNDWAVNHVKLLHKYQRNALKTYDSPTLLTSFWSAGFFLLKAVVSRSWFLINHRNFDSWNQKRGSYYQGPPAGYEWRKQRAPASL